MVGTMNTGDKRLQSELMTPKVLTVDVELPEKPTVDAVVRAFRRVLSQPLVIAIAFEANSPIRVKHLQRPGDPDFKERVEETFTPEEVLRLVPIRMVDNEMTLHEKILRTVLYAEEQGFRISHVFVEDKSILKNIGRHSEETFLGGQIMETPAVAKGMVLCGMAVDSVCCMNDVQGIYGFQVEGGVPNAERVETPASTE